MIYGLNKAIDLWPNRISQTKSNYNISNFSNLCKSFTKE